MIIITKIIKTRSDLRIFELEQKKLVFFLQDFQLTAQHGADVRFKVSGFYFITFVLCSIEISLSLSRTALASRSTVSCPLHLLGPKNSC